MKNRRPFSILWITLVVVGLLSVMPAVTEARPVQLRAAGAFVAQDGLNDGWWAFMEALEKDFSDVVQINYVGGPEAIPPFELIQAVRTGVVDMAHLAAAYYVSDMPEADAFKLATLTPAEERARGIYDYWQQLHEPLGVYYLGKTTPAGGFNMFLNKPVDRPDFTGLRIRVSPVYTDFVEALGGSPVSMAASEVYTALERGIVDGYGWNEYGLLALGWHEVTRYVIPYSFYALDMVILVNSNTWNRLPEEAKMALEQTMIRIEEDMVAHYQGVVLNTHRFYDEAGIQKITFSPEDVKYYYDVAYESAWEAIIKASPVHGPRLREMYNQ